MKNASPEPASRRARSAPTLLFAGLASLALGLAYTFQASFVARFRFDDAFITLRYAEQLAFHGTLSFNANERIDGYTSPAWTLLLAACERAGLDGTIAMLAIGRACGLLAVLASAVLARSLGARRLESIAIAALGTVFTPGFVVWSMPGMETPLAALVYTAALIAWVVPDAPRLARLRAALAFAAALVRPEGALLAAMLIALELGVLRGGSGGRASAFRARPYALVVLALAGLFVWRWSYYGHPLPNTFYAKASTPGLVALGIEDAKQFLRQRGLFLAPCAALWLAARGLPLRARATVLVFAAWFACVIVTYARTGGDFPGFHRFYQPMVPASFAVLAAFLADARSRPPRGSSRVVGALGVLLLSAWLVVSDADVLPSAFERDAGLIRSQTEAVEEWERAGRALAPILPRPARMASRAAGVLPLRARADFVYDTIALNNPEVAHHNPALHDVPAHQKEATMEQMLRWGPNVIVGHPDVETSDRSGDPPAWNDAVELRDAGFRFRCVPMRNARFVCVWIRSPAP